MLSSRLPILCREAGHAQTRLRHAMWCWEQASSSTIFTTIWGILYDISPFMTWSVRTRPHLPIRHFTIHCEQNQSHAPGLIFFLRTNYHYIVKGNMPQQIIQQRQSFLMILKYTLSKPTYLNYSKWYFLTIKMILSKLLLESHLMVW